jgi:TBC1 domain family protein 5
MEDQFLRPTSWKIFLETFPSTSSGNILNEWIETISEQREEYKRKFKKFCKIKKFTGDPLGGKTSEKKSKSETEDEELKHLINLDLSRTYQDIDLFLQSKTKNLLADVLFIWSKENTDISYKQGMNELLAVFYLAFYPYYFVTRTKPKPNKNDILNYIKDNKSIEDHLEDIYVFFNDEDEFKSDLFFVFDSLMKKGIKNLFNQNKLDKSDSNYNIFELFPNRFKDTVDDDVPTLINRRCSILIKEKLRVLDPQLFDHFKQIDLSCSIFLQRWLRCLFNREFQYREVLILWDAIFAYEFSNKKNQKYHLMYMDFIAIAMILRIRDSLKREDQNQCFTILFKYPHIENIVDLIKLSDKVSNAINEQLNGSNSDVYDILGIMKPIESRPVHWNSSGISPHEYNQKNNRKSSFGEKTNINSNFSSSNNNNNNSNINNNNNVISSNNNNDTSNEFSNQAKNLLNNAWNSLGKSGGIVKDFGMKVSDKVSETIDQLKNEQPINNNQEEYNNYGTKKSNDIGIVPIRTEDEIKEENNYNNNHYNYNESNYNNENNDENIINGYNRNDMQDIINKLEELDTRYNMFMNPKDKKDFRTIISYLKNNLQ